MTRRAAVTVTLLGAATWGTTGTAQALADVDVAPVLVGAARTLVGAVALLGVAALLGSRAPTDPGVLRAAWRPQVVAGLSILGYQAAFFAGVDRAGVALGTLVGIGAVPVATGLISWVVDGRRPTHRWWTATAVAVVGTALVLGPGADAATDVVGLGLAVLAGVLYALHTVAGRRVLDAGVPPRTMVAAAYGLGAPVALVLLMVGDAGGLLAPRGLVLAAWLGAVTVGAGALLVGTGLRSLDAPTVGTLTLAEPLVAAGLGVLLLGERTTPVAAVGAGLVLVGLVLLARPPAARRPRVASR